MREALRPLEGQRITVTGTVTKFGCRPLGFDLHQETLMLEHVTGQDGAVLTDHLWVNMGARLLALDIRKGDVLTLSARVRPYIKHRFAVRMDGRYKFTYAKADFKLAYPTCIQKRAQPEGAQR